MIRNCKKYKYSKAIKSSQCRREKLQKFTHNTADHPLIRIRLTPLLPPVSHLCYSPLHLYQNTLRSAIYIPTENSQKD